MTHPIELGSWVNDFKAYDLKATGIQDYLLAGVPPDQVQLQAGITWEEMATYLEVKKQRTASSELMEKAMPLKSFNKKTKRENKNLDHFIKLFHKLTDEEMEKAAVLLEAYLPEVVFCKNTYYPSSIRTVIPESFEMKWKNLSGIPSI